MKANDNSQTPSGFFIAGGTLPPSAPSYVSRPADDVLFNLALAGEFCYVLTTRQMGKSSLMVRTARRLQDKGIQTAIIDLTTIGTGTRDTWYLDLLTELADRLNLSEDTETWWKAHTALGLVHRFSSFLRDVVLTEIESRVVVFIDEIDVTLGLAFADDFFAAIRAVYNARAADPRFNRLTFIFLGVASPSDLIRDRIRTPFNVGHGIALGDFDRAEAAMLQKGLEAACPGQGVAILDRIYYWTDGHPYLTQRLCREVVEAENDHWTHKEIDRLVDRLFLSNQADKETSLQTVQDRVLKHSHRRQLLTLYRRVHEGKRIDSNERSYIQNQLKLSGLVKTANGHLCVHNEIYRRIFDLEWARKNTQRNWARFAIYGFGMTVVLFVLLVGVGLGYNSVYVPYRVQAAKLDFYQVTTPQEHVDHLAELFELHGLGGMPDYDSDARELFFRLPRKDQLAMFDGRNERVTVVVEGLYVTLADVDNTGSTTSVLETMFSAIDRLGETKQTTKLRDEINSWLQGRQLAKQNQYDKALVEYNKATGLNNDNPATRYERAKVLIGLSAYQQALGDLDQVIGIARRTPTFSAPSATVRIASDFATGEQMIGAVRDLIYGKESLIRFLATASSSDYPNLRDSVLSLLVSVRLDALAFPGGWLSGASRPESTISLANSPYNCLTGSDCLRITYKPGGEWGGVFWWPSSCGETGSPDAWNRAKNDTCGINILEAGNLGTAERLTFWARGERGNEIVEFKIGGLDISPKPGRSMGKVTLDSEWKQYEIDLTGMDLTSAVALFIWVAADSDNPQGAVFYLDDIQFEGTKK